MTSDALASAPPAGAARSWWLPAGCALVAAAKLLLVADDELVARAGPLDQVRFLEMAGALGRGLWLGPWDSLALIREPGYPLWVAGVHAIGAPLRPATELLLLASAGLFCAALRRAGASRWMVLAAYALIALEPHSLIVNRDALPAGFYLPVLLCALAGLIFAVEAPSTRRVALHAAWAGVCLGVLWFTRPEKLALLPLLAVPVAWDFLRRRGARAGPALARGGALLGTAAVATACVAGSVAAVNRAHYGVFASTAVTAPGYLAANRALTSIEQRAPRRFVPVPAEVRVRAYAASPAFRQLRPVLEGPSWARVVSCNVDRVCDDIGAGYFRWLLREAAGRAGYLGTAAEADAFFARIADEIDAACASGALACRASHTSFLHPVPATWLPHVGQSAMAVFEVALRGRAWQVADHSRDRPATPERVRRLFDEVANRRRELTRNGEVRIAGRVSAARDPVAGVALQTRFTRIEATTQAGAAGRDAAAAQSPVDFAISFDKRRRKFESGESRLVFTRESGATVDVSLERAVAGRQRQGDLEVAIGSFVETNRESPLRRGTRAALWSLHPFLYGALIVFGALAAAALLASAWRDRVAVPAFGAFLLVISFVALRFAMLILVDASSFPARSSRYVYAAVPLAGCGALLLIDQAWRVLAKRFGRAPD